MLSRQPNIAINQYVRGERRVLANGTTLASRKPVNLRSAYKESMLVLGILVALIVLAVTFWSIQKKPVILDKLMGSSATASLPDFQHFIQVLGTSIAFE